MDSSMVEGGGMIDPKLMQDTIATTAAAVACSGNGSKIATSEEMGLSESLLEKKNRALCKSSESSSVHMASSSSSSSSSAAVSSRYVFKREGLVKRTISAKVDGHWQHLVCYYSRADFSAVMTGPPSTENLFAPDLMAELRSVRVPIDLVVQQNFRRPPLLTTAGVSGREVPLLSAPRPRRHSSSASHNNNGNGGNKGVTGNNPSNEKTSATPIPIVDEHVGIMPDIVEECVDAVMSAKPGIMPSLLPPPSLLVDIIDNDGAETDRLLRPRWIDEQQLHIANEQDTDGDRDDEQWSGCFLRGHDPALPPFSTDC